jgi:hypothetical protein
MISYFLIAGWRPLKPAEKVEVKDAFFFQTNGLFKRLASEINVGQRANTWTPSGYDDNWDEGDVYPYRRTSNTVGEIKRRLVSSRKEPQPLPLP